MTDDEWDELIDDQLEGKLPESTPQYIRRLCQEKKELEAQLETKVEEAAARGYWCTECDWFEDQDSVETNDDGMCMACGHNHGSHHQAIVQVLS